MLNLKADLTAVVREDNEIHILKASFIDDNELYFQMYNKTMNIYSPCFIIDTDWGSPKKGFDKEFFKYLRSYKNINRYRLVFYFNLFKLNFLTNIYHN